MIKISKQNDKNVIFIWKILKINLQILTIDYLLVHVDVTSWKRSDEFEEANSSIKYKQWRDVCFNRESIPYCEAKLSLYNSKQNT